MTPMARRPTRSNTRAPRWVGFWSVVLLLCASAGAAAFWVGRSVIGEWGARGTPIRDLTTNLLAEEKKEGKTAWEKRAQQSRETKPMVEVIPAEPTEQAGAQPAAEQPQTEEPAPGEEASSTKPKPEEGKSREQPEAAPPGPRGPAKAAGTGTASEKEQPASKGFVVRAGSFTDEKYLAECKAALKQHGYHYWVTDYQREGTLYHRVNVGEFPTREEAELFKKELAQSGITADVVPPGARGR